MGLKLAGPAIRMRLLASIPLVILSCWSALGQSHIPGTSATGRYNPQFTGLDASGNSASTTLALGTNPSAIFTQGYTITTLAGGGLPINIPGVAAALALPDYVAVDGGGNVYFSNLNTVLRLDAVTQIVTLFAGTGTSGYSGDGGQANSAQVSLAGGLAIDSSGSVYIADYGNGVIRKVTNGVITTVAGNGTCYVDADGPALTTGIGCGAVTIAVDATGNLYFIGASIVREVAGGMIVTIAGNGEFGFSGDGGPATIASLNNPMGLAVDVTGNVYIADTGNNRLRRVTNGIISTVAGNGTASDTGDNGPALNAELESPRALALDAAGNLFIADNAGVRKLAGGIITTPATFSANAIAVDSGDSIYAAEPLTIHDIQKSSSGAITTIAGNGTAFSGDGGTATTAQLVSPVGVAADSGGNVYIADDLNELGGVIRKVANGTIARTAGIGPGGFSGDNGPATSALVSAPESVATDASGNLYFNDTDNERIRKVSPDGVISTVAGNGTAGFSGDGGPATSAELNLHLGVLGGVAVDAAGNLYFSDTNNNRVREVSNGVITTVAGNGTAGFSGDGGPATSAQFDLPGGVAVDASGNLYIADFLNQRIRKVSNGVITTVAGDGNYAGPDGPAASTGIGFPKALVVDAAGNVLFSGGATVRELANGTITTIAGGGSSFGDGGPAASAQLANPAGLAVDAAGRIYVADRNNQRIRLLTPPPLSMTSPAMLAAGTVGVAYPGVTFTATGGNGVYLWSAAGLSAGMNFSSAGVLGGVPSSPGMYTVQFTVSDTAGHSASTTLSLAISSPAPALGRGPREPRKRLPLLPH